MGSVHPIFAGSKNRRQARTHTWREILNAIFYIVRSGCAWRLLPRNLPPWKTVYHYFRLWRTDGSIKESAKYLSPPGRGSLLYFHQMGGRIAEIGQKILRGSGGKLSAVNRIQPKIKRSGGTCMAPTLKTIQRTHSPQASMISRIIQHVTAQKEGPECHFHACEGHTPAKALSIAFICP